MHYLMVAAGGALGAMARYFFYTLALRLEQHAALATFSVNLLGAFLIGIMFVLLTEKAGMEPHLQNLLSIGFLGAFTTYSTYSLDALRMLQNGQIGMALVYLLGTMLVCLLAVWLGANLARQF